MYNNTDRDNAMIGKMPFNKESLSEMCAVLVEGAYASKTEVRP